MNIKKFKQFVEGIMVGDIGPVYGRQELKNTIDTSNTELIHSPTTGKIYTYEDYQEMYNDYLKNGGSPLQGGFTLDNIEKCIEVNN